MNKKSKKGFTILELLAAVVIVGIILSLAVVAINKYLLKGRNAVDSQLEKQLVLSAKSYYSDNKSKFITNENTGVVIWYTTLKAENYITNDLVDSNGNSCSKSYVVVKKDNSKYSYSGCILCDNDGYNNTKDKEECTESLKNNIYCEWRDSNNKALTSNDKIYLGVKKNNEATLKLFCKGRGIKFNNGSSLNNDNINKMITSDLGKVSVSDYNSSVNNKNEITSFVSDIKYTTLSNANGNDSISFNENSAYVVYNSTQIVPNVAVVYDGINIDGKGPSCTLSGPYKKSDLKTQVKSVKGGSTVYYGLTCNDDSIITNIDTNTIKNGFENSNAISNLNVSKLEKGSNQKSFEAVVSVTVNNPNINASKKVFNLNLAFKSDVLKDNYDNGNDRVTSQIGGKTSVLSIDDQGPTCAFNGPAHNAEFIKAKKTLNIKNDDSNEYAVYELRCTDENGIDLNTFKFSDIKNNGFGRIELSGSIMEVKNNNELIGYKYYINAYENPDAVANSTKAYLEYDTSKLSDTTGNKGSGIKQSNSVIMVNDEAIPKCEMEAVDNGNGTVKLTGSMSDTVGLANYTWTTSEGDPSSYDYSTSGTSDTATERIYKSDTYYLHMVNEIGLTGYCMAYVNISAPDEPSLTASDGKSSGSWHNSNFTLTASESGSGVIYYYGSDKYSMTTTKSSITEETTGDTYYAKACWSFNDEVCSKPVQYLAKLDKTPPKCDITMRKFSGSLSDGNIKSNNDEGKYESNKWTQYGVKISIDCSDTFSGISSKTIEKPNKTINDATWTAITSTEGDGIHNVTVSSGDKAGNNYSETIIVKRDTVPPTLKLSIAPSTGSGKKLCKYNSVTVTCTDKRSGISAMTADDFKTKAVSKEETLKDASGGTGEEEMKKTVVFSDSGSRYLRAGCVDGALNGTWTGEVYDLDAYYLLPKSRKKTESSGGYDNESDCLKNNDECVSRYRRTKYTNGKANYSWKWAEDRTSQNTTKNDPVTWCKASTACEYYGTSQECNKTIANASTTKGKRRCRKCSGGNDDFVNYTLDICKFNGYGNYDSVTDYPTSCTSSGEKGSDKSYTACSASASWYIGYNYDCSW